MKTILFTGFDDPYAGLARITGPRMLTYARRHGMDFFPYHEPPPGLNIYWTGIARGLELLREGYDRVMYLDVDQLITNPDNAPLIGADYGLWISQDWGEDATEPWHFSACGWYAHRDCIPMFEAVLAMEPEWRDKPFQEQGPWQAVVRMMLKDQIVLPGQVENGRVKEVPAGLINTMQRRYFNAVPDEVCPGKVPEPWQPGDFAAHLTMLPMEERIALASKTIAASMS